MRKRDAWGARRRRYLVRSLGTCVLGRTTERRRRSCGRSNELDALEPRSLFKIRRWDGTWTNGSASNGRRSKYRVACPSISQTRVSCACLTRPSSRRFKAMMEAQLGELMNSGVHNLDLGVVMLYGIRIADRALVIASGITFESTKHVWADCTGPRAQSGLPRAPRGPHRTRRRSAEDHESQRRHSRADSPRQTLAHRLDDPPMGRAPPLSNARLHSHAATSRSNAQA